MSERIYVTGHRNPDLDSIASAIGYAELKSRKGSGVDYVPVRLGSVNAQTAWALERSEAPKPDLMGHVMLRVRDVMRESFPIASYEQPVREVGRIMARLDLDLVPIVDDDGKLIGVMTERALARRYVRESRKVSSLVDAPTSIAVIAEVLDAQVIVGGEGKVEGRVWVHSIDPERSESQISPGDVVVVGDRTDAQKQSLELGASMLVVSNGNRPADEVLDLAREKGAAVAVSPLDSYVSSRMVTLAAPCGAMADGDPLTVGLDDLVSDISEQVKDVHYRAAVALDEKGKPIGLVTRSDLVSPKPRKVILVDHAEAAQSVPGVEQAEIVEILDHHHIGSIETRVPVTATFDPVGSTATLVVERFRANGYEPAASTAKVLLCAVLSDTVLLNSPTTTERDRTVMEYLEQMLDIDAIAFGREMFEATSDVSNLTAAEIVGRDSKEYVIGSGDSISIAQIETVGTKVLERQDELDEAIKEVCERNGYALAALMVTDILERGTYLLATGDEAAIERAFGSRNGDGVFHLPDVMSRKKQVAPALMNAM